MSLDLRQHLRVNVDLASAVVMVSTISCDLLSNALCYDIHSYNMLFSAPRDATIKGIEIFSVDIVLLSQNAQCLCPDCLPVLTNMTPPSLSILLPTCTWSSQPARLSWTDDGWKNILAGLMDSSPHSREVLMEFTNRATPEVGGRWQPAG